MLLKNELSERKIKMQYEGDSKANQPTNEIKETKKTKKKLNGKRRNKINHKNNLKNTSSEG